MRRGVGGEDPLEELEGEPCVVEDARGAHPPESWEERTEERASVVVGQWDVGRRHEDHEIERARVERDRGLHIRDGYADMSGDERPGFGHLAISYVCGL